MKDWLEQVKDKGYYGNNKGCFNSNKGGEKDSKAGVITAHFKVDFGLSVDCDRVVVLIVLVSVGLISKG